MFYPASQVQAWERGAALNELTDLKLDKRNANRGAKRGADLLALSLEEGGAGRSVLADRDMNVLAGNQTVKAWEKTGGKIRVVETDGSELVVVKRTDVSLDDPETETRARRMALFDNRTSEVGLEWDVMILQEDAGLGILDGLWTDAELVKVMDLANIYDAGTFPDVPSMEAGGGKGGTEFVVTVTAPIKLSTEILAVLMPFSARGVTWEVD